MNPNSIDGIYIKLIHRPQCYEIKKGENPQNDIAEDLEFLSYKGDECVVTIKKNNRNQYKSSYYKLGLKGVCWKTNSFFVFFRNRLFTSNIQ